MTARYVFVCATALAIPAFALNPNYQISQYAHSAWRSEAGITAVRRIKQTPDGYLWLATRGGLLRFDGVRFKTFKAGSEPGLESSTTQDLLLDPDGSMWIATLGGGIAYYHSGTFRTYTAKDGLPSDDIGSLYRDSRGTLWAGTRGAGVARMVNGKFERVPLIPSIPITAFLEGQDHSMWISSFGYGVFRLQDGVLTSFTVKEGLPDNRVDALYQDHSGTLWTAGWKGISSWNGARFVGNPSVNAVVNYAISCTEDRDGNLWIASASGLFRARGTELIQMNRSSGLSGNFTSDVFEDREGNLWVGTRGGLDRFRGEKVRFYAHSEGPIVADNRGVWTASNRQIAQVSANATRTWPVSLPTGSKTLTLLSQPEGGFLIGFDKGVARWTHERVAIAPQFSGLDARCLLQARDGSIWIGTANRGLLRWRPSANSGTLTETGVLDRSIATLAEDRDGVVWAGAKDGGGLYRFAGESVQRFGADEGLRSLNVYAVFVDGQGKLWIGSSGGLSWFQDGRLRTVNSQQGLPADQVFAVVDDSYNNLWFAGFPGIASIGKKSLTDWGSGRREKLTPILYRNAAELQVRAGDSVFPAATRSVDGHLWFSVADGLVEVIPPDPATSRPTQFPVLVEEITVDGASHSELSRIRLKPGARSIELRYTALTLSSPETVRFRYRLEGVDNDWVDADTRRLAFYDNLKPRAYRFRVAASTDDEQWQESSALVLEQLPFFYQTWWFTVLASAVAVSVLFSLYRLRLYQIAREFNARLEERVGERTRIARELHDTLLQSFQGLLLEFQAAPNMFPRRPEEAMQTLDGAISSARSAITEGRDAIQDLRLGPGARNDLAYLLTAAGKELSEAQDLNGRRATFGMTVEGPRQTLSPVLQDEVYRIGREILRNAFSHARAKRIEVEIRYDARMLRVRIRDDGIGIDPKVLDQGARPRHWGLPGVRERAKLIGAKLDLWSEAGAGTEVQITIPAAVAYEKSREPDAFRILRKLIGSHGN